jgi:hypothetical protein
MDGLSQTHSANRCTGDLSSNSTRTNSNPLCNPLRIYTRTVVLRAHAIDGSWEL